MFGWQFCSDSEDLFGDYDSILEDSSILARLDDAEQRERLQSEQLQGFRTPPPSTDAMSCSAAPLGDELEDLPPSQLQFQEQIQDQAKRCRLQVAKATPTPPGGAAEIEEPEGAKRRGGVRRSMAEQLKEAMLGNAAAPATASRSEALKEAVISKEISEAMEAISAEAADLGPFFGLPSKVKELMLRLRGIQRLYGENMAAQRGVPHSS